MSENVIFLIFDGKSVLPSIIPFDRVPVHQLPVPVPVVAPKFGYQPVHEEVARVALPPSGCRLHARDAVHSPAARRKTKRLHKLTLRARVEDTHGVKNRNRAARAVLRSEAIRFVYGQGGDRL